MDTHEGLYYLACHVSLTFVPPCTFAQQDCPFPACPKLSLLLGSGSAHPRAWSSNPGHPNICHTPIITFTTLHVTKATIWALWGTWWDKGPVGWEGLEDFVIFLQLKTCRGVQQRGTILPMSMVTIFLVCFALFSLILFLCPSST